MQLAVHTWGEGPRVVLVHGGGIDGRHGWRAQRDLAQRWTLVAPDRIGHGASPDGRQDFEVDARLLAEQLLDEPAHLVGYSYGGLGTALAAAQRPEWVRSLTLVEPPAAGVLAGDAGIEAWVAELREAITGVDDPREVLRRFFAVVGVPLEPPPTLPAFLERGARALSGARPVDEAELPLDALRDADFPVLVVSGGHLEAFERICDAIAAATDAQREVVRGAAHLVPDVGPRFNAVLERFWLSAAR